MTEPTRHAIKTVETVETAGAGRSGGTRRPRPPGRRRFLLGLYLLVLPSVLSLLVFSYYPKIDVVWMSFFRWEPPSIQEYIGLENYRDAFSDPLFWDAFKLVGILLVANIVKLWPGIFAAIALHRIRSDKWRYRYQVLFVVPMIIPAMVWLLIWKSFYDPEFGILNRFLNASGGMAALNTLDGLMPRIASALDPFFAGFIDPLFGNLGGLFFVASLVIAMSLWREHGPQRRSAFGALVALGLLVPLCVILGALSGPGAFALAAVGIVCGCLLLARSLEDAWIAWPFLILAGTVIFWGELFRLPLYLLLAIGLYELLRRRDQIDWIVTAARMRWAGIGLLAAATALLFLGAVWTEPVGQFEAGQPAWLGHQDLVIPAILFWGFPWVGTVGVLIYLSGLQNISADVYEAAELDGVSPLRMILSIELPLIMTQVRINLIFLTISTLTAFEIFLILLGPEGGPGNKGMVPGLYMYSSAFSEGRFGYACALGMVLFVIILLLTIIYQKYVKVDK